MVIVDLLPGGKIRKSRRKDAIRPANAKRNVVRRILGVAATHSTELMLLWEATHGPAS
jgi:hypothetical protein